jgi:hypothetical protein
MQNAALRIQRLLIGLAAAIAIWSVAVFAYGLAHFPAYPYKPCEQNQYCDKVGKHHSKAEFEAFSRWNHILLLSWPLGVVAVISILRMRSSNEKP